MRIGTLYRVAERIISRIKKFSRKSFLAADAFRLKEIMIASPSREIVYVRRVVATDASEISMRRDGCGETAKLFDAIRPLQFTILHANRTRHFR